jgi:hypothetical protein
MQAVQINDNLGYSQFALPYFKASIQCASYLPVQQDLCFLCFVSIVGEVPNYFSRKLIVLAAAVSGETPTA